MSKRIVIITQEAVTWFPGERAVTALFFRLIRMEKWVTICCHLRTK